MKLVRRARKSIKERRMKDCLNELTSNLSKVEARVFKVQKQSRDARRKVLGLPDPIPHDILQGRMNPELYDIECRLHREAGLPKPLPYPGYYEDRRRGTHNVQRIGFVDFHTLMLAVKRRNRAASRAAV